MYSLRKNVLVACGLEATPHDLWIWHAFFGMPGSHNDINVLQQSPVFRRLCNGESLSCNYIVNGRDYNMVYYLAGGIYSKWEAFVKTISDPMATNNGTLRNNERSS